MRDERVRRMSALHRRLYQMTGGVVGRRLVGNDMLLLTTTGRRSGHPHTVPLLYLRDTRDLVVIASYGGRDRHPAWYLNLVAEPRATVQIRSERIEVTARTAPPAERAEWWPHVVAAFSDYAVYAGRTEREIPVVFLTPIGS